ncbi:MAG: universal stress protein, partial [Anaerolineae bacterium]
AAKTMAHAVDGIDHEIEFEIVEGDDVVAAILQAARDHDMIVIGATDEPVFRNLLLGNIPEEVARRAEVTTIMVKRRSGPVKSLLRTTVLSPTTGDRVS